MSDLNDLPKLDQIDGDDELLIRDKSDLGDGTFGTDKYTSVAAMGRRFAPIYVGDRSQPYDPPFWADEFDGPSLGPAWTTILPTGELEVVVRRGVCSMAFNAQASSDMAGIGRALPADLPTPYAIEASYRVWTERQNHLMAGPFVSTGVDVNASVMWWMPYWGQDSFIDSFRAGTITNINTDYSSIGRYPYGSMGVDSLLCRLVIDTSLNKIRVEKSIDGVLWSLHGTTAFDRALNFTPTHFGFGVSTWGGTTTGWSRLTSIDYLRIYAV